jgi:26S proteasome regulatory subunit N3
MYRSYKVSHLFNADIAVRIGDLGIFNTAMTTHESTFRKDDTFTLMSRLRQNVIKTGLRTISLTYSRITLHDVCLKLGLDSEETTEYIVAKAIRDGVIEATINHDGRYMQNKEVLDVYATEEPLLAFDERIKFCMSLHNEAVKVFLGGLG